MTSLKQSFFQETCTMVLDLLEEHFSKDKSDEGVRALGNLVYQACCRPGWLGSLIPAEKKAVFLNTVEKATHTFYYSKEPAYRQRFANQLTQQIIALIPPQYLQQAVFEEGSPKERLHVAASWLAQEAKTQVSEEEMVNRVLKRLQQRDWQNHKSKETRNIYLKGPLRKLWGIPDHMASALPAYDIRSALMRTQKSDSALFGILEKAAPFSPALMKKALGEELWSVAKPVGYLDQNNTIVCVEVSSSAHMQTLHFKKSVLLQHLKKIPGLEKVKDIKLKLATHSGG